MLERVPKRALNFFAGRVIDNLVILKSNKEVDNRFKQLIEEGGVPIVYANHQGHFDGVAIAKVSEYLRNSTNLQGLAVIFARSMVTGHQGEEVKNTFDLFIGGGRQKGIEPVPVTREKDQVYGLSRLQIAGELRPLIRSLHQGFGMAIFPEGSVQGGCHPKGAGIEDIYGMQEIRNDNLRDFFQFVDKIGKYKKPFFVPVGLHDSFRIMQKTDGGKPKLTYRGTLSLIVAAFGLPFGLKIQANLLNPFTAEEIASDLGPDWMQDGSVFNRYAMERLKAGLPIEAWGVYKIQYSR